MMTRFLLAALCVLLTAGPASAECAWVLWMKTELVNVTAGKIESDGWQIESAVPTYAACTTSARRRAERTAEPSEGPNVKGTGLNELIGGGFRVSKQYRSPEHASASVEFRCFPDTVDPRGPKGK